MSVFCLVATLPSTFWIACCILSVATTVPAPAVYPVSTFPITAALVTVGNAAVPDRSPANWILPLIASVASTVPEVAAAVTKAVVAS